MMKNPLYKNILSKKAIATAKPEQLWLGGGCALSRIFAFNMLQKMIFDKKKKKTLLKRKRCHKGINPFSKYIYLALLMKPENISSPLFITV
jgi:hypothetical protein